MSSAAATNAKKRNTRGVLYMLLASVLFATGGLVLKYTDWNPLAINGMRALPGAIVIGLFMWISHRKLVLNKTVIAGAIAYMAMTTLFVLSNKLTAAGNAIVLQFTCPIWIVVLNFILFRKLPTKKQVIALILILGGIVCFFVDSLKSGNWVGDLLAILSGLFFAIMFMLNSLKGGDALSSVFIGQIGTFICLFPFVFGCTWTVSNTLSILWLGAFQVGFAYLFFSLATGMISALEASLINAVEPVLNPMLVALFGFERQSGLSLLGAAIVIGAVLWNSLPAKEDAQTQSVSQTPDKQTA